MSKYVKFFQLSQRLKQTKRSGWLRFKEILQVESVADHSWMISLIALTLPDAGRLNKDWCIKVALLHDLAEVLVGDITPHDKVPADEKKRKEDEAIKQMIAELDEDIKGELYKIHSEYENGVSAEAQIVRELDKFEMMVQAFTYEQKFGVNLEEFFESRVKIQSEFVTPLLAALLKEREEYHKQKQVIG